MARDRDQPPVPDLQDCKWYGLHKVRQLPCLQEQILRYHPKSVIIPHSRIYVYRYSYFINSTLIWNQLPLDVIQSFFKCIQITYWINVLFHNSHNSIMPLVLTNHTIPYSALFMYVCVTGEHFNRQIAFSAALPLSGINFKSNYKKINLFLETRNKWSQYNFSNMHAKLVTE